MFTCYSVPYENKFNFAKHLLLLIRCPSVLTLLIRVLECNMIASRSFWQHRVANRFFVSSQEGRRVSTATAPSSPSVLLPITKETESRGGSTRPTLLPIPGGEPGGTVSTPSRASQPESPASDELCERLRMTLVASQDAAVVQLLFEFCLPTPEEKVWIFLKSNSSCSSEL